MAALGLTMCVNAKAQTGEPPDFASYEKAYNAAKKAYDKGYLAGRLYPITWADSVGFLTKAELTDTAKTQAYHALRGHWIKEKEYNQFVAGWLKGFLSLHAKTIRDH